MFSLSIESALTAIAEHDSTQWAKFSFFPCPVGSDTPAGCKVDPCPPKIPDCNHSVYEECCVKDKLEDCLVSTLGCNDDLNPLNSNCTFETRLKMSKFIGCFEGGHIEEYHCPQDPANCSKYAGFEDSVMEDVNKCLSTTKEVKHAADTLTTDCTAQNITAWPHVLVNKNLTFNIVPILPTLCKAYKGEMPKSCKMLEQGLITVV